MKLIIELKDNDIGVDLPLAGEFKERVAVRAVVYSVDGKTIALLHSQELGYHILPGGGIEEGEGLLDGLKREVLEEVGADISNIKEIGYTLQWQGQISREHKNYCYVTNIIGELQDVQFAEDELAERYRLLWVTPNEAIELLESDQTNDYKGKSNVKRDAAILKEALKYES